MFRTASTLRITVIAMLIALPATAFAQETSSQAETGKPPQRIRDVTVSGSETCPKGAADEVVVCHRLDEPYRIPKALRDSGPIPAQNQSWVNRVDDQDAVSRQAAGLPNTCSPVGTGGQTGCSQQIARDFAADRRARRAEDTAPADDTVTP